MMGALASRAASSEATTVDEEVTFCPDQLTRRLIDSFLAHNGWNGKFVFLCILEKVEDIVAHNDTSLACQNVLGTHSS